MSAYLHGRWACALPLKGTATVRRSLKSPPILPPPRAGAPARSSDMGSGQRRSTGSRTPASRFSSEDARQRSRPTQDSRNQFDTICCNEPIESLQFTWPAGTAGNNVDISVSDSAGSATAIAAGHYVQAVQQFALPGAALNQGIYDPWRDYYFTDQNKIQVFSRTRGIWLAPIPIPRTESGGYPCRRMEANSRRPMPSRILIYLLNPDSPSSIRTFSLPNIAADEGSYAAGLAITDSGIAYSMRSIFILAVDGRSINSTRTRESSRTTIRRPVIMAPTRMPSCCFHQR